MQQTEGRQAIAQIAEMLNEIDICVFTTTGDGGELHARPMSNNRQVEWDGDSWFFAPADGRLVAEIRREPAAVTAYRAESEYTFVSLSGQARVEQDEDLKERYWLDELKQWFPNGPGDPNVALIRFEADHAEWWGEKGDGSADLRVETAA